VPEGAACHPYVTKMDTYTGSLPVHFLNGGRIHFCCKGWNWLDGSFKSNIWFRTGCFACHDKVLDFESFIARVGGIKIFF
jgi:hypothetical protein